MENNTLLLQIDPDKASKSYVDSENAKHDIAIADKASKS